MKVLWRLGIYFVNYYPAMLEQAMEQFGVDMDTPFEDLKKEEQDLILYGSGDREFHFHYVNDFGGVRDIDIPFEGVVTNINRRYHEIIRIASLKMSCEEIYE